MISTSGFLSDNNQYSCSERIKVQKGNIVSYDLQAGNNVVEIGFYENNIDLTGFSVLLYGNNSIPHSGFITIENDGYIRVCCNNNYISLANPNIGISGKLNQRIDQANKSIDVLNVEFNDVKSEVESSNEFINANSNTVINAQEITLTWIEGSLYNLTTGTITPNASFARTEKFPCKEGDVFVIPNLAGQIVFFKANDTVSYKGGNKNYMVVRSAPEGTEYFAFNNSDQTVRPTAITQKSAETESIKTTVDAPAKIICNSDMFINGVYANTITGNLSTGVVSYYGLANYPVKASHKYRTETQTQVVFYDADMTFISAILPGGAAQNTGTRVEMDFVTPSNCAYVSINSSSSHEILFDLNYTVIGRIDNPKKLQGKKVLSFGDSITGNYGFGDNIIYEVEQICGAKTYNCGFGGCRMELLEEGGSAAETAAITNPFAMCTIVDELAKDDDDPTKWATQDEAAATFEASPRFNRIIKFRLAILKTIDITEIDIVTIAYGTNEAGYMQDNQSNKYDKYTYAGATRYAIEKLLELNPKLRIVLLTPIYRHSFGSSEGDSDSFVRASTGLGLLDNIETLKAVGLEYKVPVIDMYYDLGINKENYLSYFGDDDEAEDGTHINTYGRQICGRRLAGELIRLM